MSENEIENETTLVQTADGEVFQSALVARAQAPRNPMNRKMGNLLRDIGQSYTDAGKALVKGDGDGFKAAMDLVDSYAKIYQTLAARNGGIGPSLPTV
jgi:hypothetical protein